MKTAAAMIFFALSASAQAGWQIQSVDDRMTDKTFKFATLDAKASDSDVPATLELSCINGARAFTVKTDQPAATTPSSD